MLMCFFLTSVLTPVSAQELFLPTPGTPLSLTPSYQPVLVQGLNIDATNPFQFEFLVSDQEFKTLGHRDTRIPEARKDALRASDEIKSESQKLIKYFLASLTMPEEEMWVNLSPDEPDRIIPDRFGQTEMGRDMLAQDYMLKQLTASLMSPEGELGEQFWEGVYEEIYKKKIENRKEKIDQSGNQQQKNQSYGSASRFSNLSRPSSDRLELSSNILNRVWIVPDTAKIYEHKKGAVIVEARLKVLMEEEYKQNQRIKESENHGKNDSLIQRADASDDSMILFQKIILPAIEKEVNEGETFAQLRQIYHCMLLATWYKQKLRDAISDARHKTQDKTGHPLQEYIDHQNIAGIDDVNPGDVDTIYNQYVEAFQQGVYEMIKEEYDPIAQQIIPRKYFSGGVNLSELAMMAIPDSAQISNLFPKELTSVRWRLAPDEAMMEEETEKTMSNNGELLAYLDAEGKPFGVLFVGENGTRKSTIASILTGSKKTKYREEDTASPWKLMSPNISNLKLSKTSDGQGQIIGYSTFPGKDLIGTTRIFDKPREIYSGAIPVKYVVVFQRHYETPLFLAEIESFFGRTVGDIGIKVIRVRRPSGRLENLEATAEMISSEIEKDSAEISQDVPMARMGQDGKIVLSGDFISRFELQKIDEQTQSIVYGKNGWPFVLKLFKTDLRGIVKIKAQNTVYSYQIAQESMDEIVPDFVFVKVQQEDGNFQDGIIMRRVVPPDMEKSIMEVVNNEQYSKGEKEIKIKFMIEEYAALIRDIFDSGVFPYDAKFSNFGFLPGDKKRLVMIDPGSVSRKDYGFDDDYRIAITLNRGLLGEVDKKLESHLLEYFNGVMYENKLDEEAVISRIKTWGIHDKVYSPMPNIAEEILRSITEKAMLVENKDLIEIMKRRGFLSGSSRPWEAAEAQQATGQYQEHVLPLKKEMLEVILSFMVHQSNAREIINDLMERISLEVHGGEGVYYNSFADSLFRGRIVWVVERGFSSLASEFGHAIHYLLDKRHFHIGIAELYDIFAHLIIAELSGEPMSERELEKGALIGKFYLDYLANDAQRAKKLMTDPREQARVAADFGNFIRIKLSDERNFKYGYEELIYTMMRDAHYDFNHFVGEYLYWRILQWNGGDVHATGQMLFDVLGDPDIDVSDPNNFLNSIKQKKINEIERLAKNSLLLLMGKALWKQYPPRENDFVKDGAHDFSESRWIKVKNAMRRYLLRDREKNQDADREDGVRQNVIEILKEREEAFKNAVQMIVGPDYKMEDVFSEENKENIGNYRKEKIGVQMSYVRVQENLLQRARRYLVLQIAPELIRFLNNSSRYDILGNLGRESNYGSAGINQDKGGIDFNPTLTQIETEYEGEGFVMPLYQMVNFDPAMFAQGVNPVIIDIRPAN